MEKKKGKGSLPKEDSSADWENIIQQLQEPKDYPFPRVTVVIPTYNCAQFITLTLESVISQDYPDLEIIVVDASSKDRTLEIVRSFQDTISPRVYSVSEYNIYEMMNRGISLATGQYINFFYPGDFYITRGAVRHMMALAVDNDLPHLVYCGCLTRAVASNPKILLRPLDVTYLRKGKQPTSLQSCWFRVETLFRLGKFDSEYTVRGGYDLMTRFVMRENLRFAVSYYVLVDYEGRSQTYANLMRHSRETLQIIGKYFGFWRALKWWMVQNHFRFIKWWLQNLKLVFIGKRRG